MDLPGHVCTEFAYENWSETQICIECCRIFPMDTESNFSDANRICKRSVRPPNDRNVQFRNCISTFLGQENFTICPELEILLQANRAQFGSRRALYDFLREHSYSKAAEHTTAVFCHLFRDFPRPGLEQRVIERLMDDFDQYNRAYKSEKLFTNYQFLLYEFLRRYGFPCSRDEFISLKAIKRKSMDPIACGIFESLGWEMFNENK